MKTLNFLAAIIMMIDASTINAATTNVVCPTDNDPKEKFEQSLEELNFELNCVWDQTNAAFYEETVKGFLAEVAELKKGGLTLDEIIEVVTSKISDDKVKADFIEAMNPANLKKMNENELNEALVSNLKMMEQEGSSYWASWFFGSTVFFGGGYIVYHYVIVSYEYY